MPATQQTVETFETYSNGFVRPAAMKNLPELALCEFLIRHSGPALEAARDEAHHRANEIDARADMLHMSLLAPSMKEDALRAEAERLRKMAA